MDLECLSSICLFIIDRAYINKASEMRYNASAELELNSTTRTRPDTHGPNGVSPQKKSVRVRSGPCRVRVVEFSSYPTTCTDFVRVGSVSV